MADKRLRRERKADRETQIEHLDGRQEPELRDDERFEDLLEELDAEVLPDLPKIPGFHVCYLNTQHQSDSIFRRKRLGYTEVKPEDLPPGFDHTTVKEGSYTGCVGHREMVAFKIPEDRYQKIMAYFHGRKPDEEEGMIYENLKEAIDTDSDGKKLIHEDKDSGIGSLGRGRRSLPYQ